MNSPPNFVIVDDVDENRYLLAKTLLRKFPESVIVECQESAAAVAAVQRDGPTAIIVHRAYDCDGPSMIRLLRKVKPDTPIIMVSGRESCPEAIEAGANAFLNYDAWLRIGTVMEEVLSPHYVKPLTQTPFQPRSDFLGFRPAAPSPRV